VELGNITISNQIRVKHNQDQHNMIQLIIIVDTGLQGIKMLPLTLLAVAYIQAITVLI